MTSSDGSTVTFRRISSEVRPRALLLFARKLENDVSKGNPFDCLITGDAELQRLNREFRGKDEPTDVLSFPLQGQPAKPRRSRVFLTGYGAPPRIRLGDLAISLSRARSQARAFGHSTELEIRILMLHGVLHLLGLDHESDGGQMARAEKRWRSRLGLPTGLIERVHA